MKPLHAFLLLLLVEALYNCHALFPTGMVYNKVIDGFQYCKIEVLDLDPRKIQRACINAAFGVLFLVAMWKMRLPIFGVICAIWFTLQAVQVYLTGGYFFSDIPDWGIFAMLMATWAVLERFKAEIMELRIVKAVLNVVHRAWSPKP